MVERIEKKPPTREEEKKSSIPDSSHFKEFMIQKPGEAEFEKRKKRQLPKEEEPEEKEKVSTTSPYDTTYYTHLPEKDQESLPSSLEFWDEVKTSKKISEKKVKKPLKKEKKISPTLESLYHPKETKMEGVLKKEKEMEKKGVITKEKAETSLYSISPGKKPIKDEEKTTLKKGEKEVFPPFHEKKEKPLLWPAQLPTHIESQANAIAEKVQSYLQAHTILPLLFHQMVGTIILMHSRGVTTTEIILNSPNFENSELYGARIVIEKYSTAPESYNIRLIGNPKAVALFDSNLQTLQGAFNNSNLGFTVHLLRTEYEREKFIFHRKEGVGKDKKEKKR